MSNDASVREQITRLYPNEAGWSWRGRVHEQLLFHDAPPPSMSTGVRLTHTGYASDAVASGDKIARNLRLLELEHHARPEDPYVGYQIGRTHFVAENWTAAIDALQAAFGLVPMRTGRELSLHVLPARSVPYLPSLLRTLAYSAIHSGDIRLAIDVLQTATDLFPDYTDLYFAYATALLASGQASHLQEVRSNFD